jgi:hypothetical protein
VQIHANCRIRRIYFSDRLYAEEDLPAEFKLYLPISKQAAQAQAHAAAAAQAQAVAQKQSQQAAAVHAAAAAQAHAEGGDIAAVEGGAEDMGDETYAQDGLPQDMEGGLGDGTPADE